MNIDWIKDPKIFEVNTVPPHSDHLFYFDEQNRVNEINLNGTWKFNFLKSLEEVKSELDFVNLGFDLEKWDNIKVPAHIELSGYEQPKYVNTMYPWDGIEDILPPEIPSKINRFGLYSKVIDVDESFLENCSYIRFEGVESAIFLWVNGEFIGYSEDSFTPSEFELSKFLKKGKNKISALVVKFCTGSWLEDQDFWRFFGIFRDVKIYSVPKVHIFDLDIRTHLSNSFKNGTLEVQLKVLAKDKYSVFYKFDGESKKVSDNFLVDVKNIKLWSAENPFLYDLELMVYDEKDVLVEIVKEKVGFRKFEMKDKLMLINGEVISFRGVNRHEFNCEKGRVVSYEDTLKDILTMKQNNINALRMSHYPNNTYVYRLCDEYGLYVIDETNLETHGSFMAQGKIDKNNPHILPHNKEEWKESVLFRGKNMLERDKNHPSVIIFSCGNESYGGSVIFELSQYFRERDPSRLVHYEGITLDRTYNDTSDMESHMYTKPSGIVEYLENNPQKPIIMCEYTHSMGNSNGAMYKYIEVEEKYPMYQGGFIWDFIDQSLLKKSPSGEKFLTSGGDFDDRPNDGNFCGNGIVFADRTVTPKMSEVKFLYSPIKIVINSKDNSFTVTNKNLFTKTDCYEFVYKLYKEGILEKSYKLDIFVEPKMSKSFDLPKEKLGDFEYTYLIECNLKDDTSWGEKGHNISYGQEVVGKFSNHKSLMETPKIIDGNTTIGAVCNEVTYLFNKDTGYLISIEKNGKEYIKAPLKPNFWRAINDNERGSKLYHKLAKWQSANLYHIIDSIEIQGSSIVATHKLPFDDEVCKTVYTFNQDNSINVEIDFKPKVVGQVIQCFGVSLKMDRDFDNFTWYGSHNLESQMDRDKSKKIVLNFNKVSDNFMPYLKPQDCGNKTDVRYLTLSSNYGYGLRFASIDTAFDVKVLPYSDMEIENAKNTSELPFSTYTNITISQFNMGVGGHDTWGSLPEDEHICHTSEKGFNLKFTIDVM
ncbi:MAG: glycoside hydrolase family 2 TIM barrel-domain containing protein [Lachnospirales bacterium]